MAWVRLDDQYSHHPKVIAAGLEAHALFIGGLCYCNRYLTDGVIPAVALVALSPLVTDPAEAAGQLVECGLWETVDDGFRVPDYLEYQPSSESVKDRRQAETDRKKAWRDKKKQNRDAGRDASRDAGHPRREPVYRDASRDADATRVSRSSQPNPTPITSSGYQEFPVLESDDTSEASPDLPESRQEPRAGNHSAAFADEIWPRWPRKTGRQPAYEAWRKAVARHPMDRILVGVFAYAEHREGTQVPCMELGRFLSEDRWAEWVDGPPAGEGPVKPDRAARDAAIDAGLDRVFAELEAEEAS